MQGGALRFLDGGGETGALIRAHDWAATPLGRPEGWPPELKALVGMMLAAAQPMFIAWGRHERTTLYNQHYAELMGPKHPAGLGRSITDIWAEAAADLEPLIEEVYRGISVHNDDITLFLDRGEGPKEAHFAFSYTPVRDEAGTIVGLFCPCLETSDRVERRRAADRERERQARLFTHAPGFIAILDGPEHRFEFVNAAYRTLVGDRDYVGRTVRDVLPDVVEQGYIEVLDHVFATGQRHVSIGQNLRLQTSADWPAHEAVLDFVFEPISDAQGRVTGIFISGQEVTARHIAETARARSEARFRAAVEAVSGIMWTNSAEGEMVGPQPGWAALTGQSETEYRGYGWADAVHPDDAQPTIAAWQEAVARRGPFAFEHRVRRHDGEWRHFSVRAIPALDQNGTIREWIGVHTDVTDERAVQAALVESEENYRFAVEVHPQVAWTARPDGQLDHVAERWHEWTGTSGLGDSWGKGLHPEDVNYSADAWANAIATGTSYDVEHRVARLDGSYRWARSRAFPRRDATGRIVKWYGSTEDIDDRKRAEVRAFEAARELRGVVDALPGFAWTADAEGLVQYASPTWLSYSGSSHEQALGAGWTAFVHPDERAIAMDRWRRSLATGEPFEVELRLRAADGSYHWWLARARRQEEGGGWIGTATEVDAIIAARETLAQSREALEGLVMERTAEVDRVWVNSRDLLVIIEPDGTYRKVSPSWTRVLGHSTEDVIGRKLTDFTFPEDLPVADSGFQKAGAAVDLVDYVCRAQHLDGSPRWIAWDTLFDDGLIYGYGRDITEERAAAERLRETEEQLRQSQKLEAIGQLTGGVAHDFNNLLTVIRGSIDLLRRPGVTEAKRQRYMEAISETVTRAAKLTGQLLAFARRQALNPESFDAAATLRDIRPMIGTLSGPRVRVELVLPEEPLFIHADHSQFETAIVNLVANARDAMDGEGTLTITVDRRAMESGEHVAVRVADTGTGIEPSRQSTIFEPFYTTKSVGRGTGLGLSQVYGFSKQSGGEVTVQSALGEGATFTLCLPRVVAPTRSDAAASHGQITEGHGMRVLVVEDNPEVGQFARATLAELGYETVFAESGAAALDVLAADPSQFDIVFSDVMMPGMTGIELAEEVRRRHSGLPVLLTSGYSHVLAEHGSRGFELLHKPYSMEELSAALGANARRRAEAPVTP